MEPNGSRVDLSDYAELRSEYHHLKREHEIILRALMDIRNELTQFDGRLDVWQLVEAIRYLAELAISKI